jgi:hypothetical protein
MTRQFLTLGGIFSLLLVLSGCETDNLDQRQRYFTEVRVQQIPFLNYDADGSAPDLRIDLKRRSVNFWEFSSLTRINAERLPLSLVFPSEILATDEFYAISLVDEDPNELQDDEIFYWEFQAVEEGRNGSIEFFDQGQLILELFYERK